MVSLASMENEHIVLIVDDEQDFVEAVVKRLMRRGFRVYGVNGGQEALDILRQHPVDVVVLDVLMPGMDGLETLRRMKEMHPQVQVILLSGHGGEELGMRGMAYGAFAYLLKPVAFSRLVETIIQASENAPLR